MYYPLLRIDNDYSKEEGKKYGKGYGLDRRLLEQFIEAVNPANKLPENLSLIYSAPEKSDESIAGLPPVLMIAAQRDIIIDEERNFQNRLEKNGILINYIELPGAIHGFMSDRNQNTALNLAVRLTGDFLRQISNQAK